MKRAEVITLGADGIISSELVGFEGAACLEHAATLAAQLEALGVHTRIDDLSMKHNPAADQTHAVSGTTKKTVEVAE
jgi:hypothetical protein